MIGKDIVEGTWRRMFELDMREDAADFSSKVIENELKELAEEIGELNGKYKYSIKIYYTMNFIRFVAIIFASFTEKCT